MIVVGEVGDVNIEIIESWNERVRKIIRGWKVENISNMDEIGSVWYGFSEKIFSKKGRVVLVGNKLNKGLYGYFS